MFANVIIFCLVLLVIALVLKVRGMAQDIETLYNMIRAVQNLPPKPGTKPTAEAPSAETIMDRHVTQYHKR